MSNSNSTDHSARGPGKRPPRAPVPTPPPISHPPQHAPAERVPSTTSEDYLERISELIEQKGYARVVDIAAMLQVSQPSVTAMVKRLADAGFLHYERYRGLILTDSGRAVALEIRNRHALLKRFLSLLQLDEQTQETDIEGLEHSLSPPTLQRLAELVNFFEANPRLLRDAFIAGKAKRRK